MTAEKKKDETVDKFKSYLEKAGIDIKDLEKEYENNDEALKRLDRRIQKARNMKRY